MDKFVALVKSRVWSMDHRLLSAFFNVFCALITTGHDSNAPFATVPELMDAFVGDPVTLLEPVVINFTTLQLLVDTCVFSENEYSFNFVRDNFDRLTGARTPGANSFRGSDEFWTRYFNVTFSILKKVKF